VTVFTATATLVGQNGKEVKRFFDLGDFTEGTAAADYAAAEAAIGQITAALAAITDAALRRVTLTAVQFEDLVTPGGGDVFENALLNLYLDAAGEKVTQHYVPAPVIGVFLATDGKNRDVIDTGDVDLVQYVQQLSQHAFVSDGEQVDVTVNDGIESGVRSVRNLKLG
jgi:hypothetical protein